MKSALYAAGILQTRSYRVLQGRVLDCLQDYDLNHAQWVMLEVIAKSDGGVTLRATADALGVKAPLITAMANELISQGYITRSGGLEDRRAKFMTITTEGRAVLGTLDTRLTSILEQLLHGLSIDELTTYEKVLTTIIDNSQKLDDVS